ncbi:MAG TPA: hypothetical protein VI749_09570 [Candidatus Omnitrophota bacterium]|nr:hypothetical protein [Candidatus Omnitrophota bacterium]
MSLSTEEKQLLLSRSRRFLNYLVLKIGLFAIASVWAVADFVNRGIAMRVVYVVVVLGLIFYIYFYLDSRKYFQHIDKIVKSQ